MLHTAYCLPFLDLVAWKSDIFLLLYLIGCSNDVLAQESIFHKHLKLQPKFARSWEWVQSGSVLARVEWPSLHDLSRNPRAEYWKSIETNYFPCCLSQWREFAYQGQCVPALRYDTVSVTHNPQTIAIFFVCLCFNFFSSLLVFFFKPLKAHTFFLYFLFKLSSHCRFLTFRECEITHMVPSHGYGVFLFFFGLLFSQPIIDHNATTSPTEKISLLKKRKELQSFIICGSVFLKWSSIVSYAADCIFLHGGE